MEPLSKNLMGLWKFLYVQNNEELKDNSEFQDWKKKHIDVNKGRGPREKS
jgi:hypothetical protein